MREKLVLGLSLLLAASGSFAGGASGQFGVQITLTSTSNSSCTSATNSGSSGSSVQVFCTANVFSQNSVTFLPGYRPARDSLLPDYCRNEQSRTDQASRFTCRLDDQRKFAAGGTETEEGWEMESQLYAVNTDDTSLEMKARLRLQNDRGILTAIRLAGTDGRSGLVEMLVSF